MKALLDPSHEAFLVELRTYLDGLDSELVTEAQRENLEDPMSVGPRSKAFLQQLGRDGWTGVGWPKEYGGQGRTPIEQWLFAEEMYYRRLPSGLLTFSSIGPSILAVGTPEQKDEFLPQILAGNMVVAIGYSEPNAGSDLASLQTRAARDGDDYIITGQKIWTTGAQHSSHVWLAARTGPKDSRHKGISLFVVPMESRGLSVRPIYTQGGERTNELFLDGVRVPITHRIGAEDQGWAVIMLALNYERLFCHADARWEFDLAVTHARGDGRIEGTSIETAHTRLKFAELAADLEVARLFAMRGAWMLDNRQIPISEASINKVWWSELRQRVLSAALDLTGENATVGYGSPHAPVEGRLERAYRTSTVWKFGGGTNEVQRDIIAQQGLGMPR